MSNVTTTTRTQADDHHEMESRHDIERRDTSGHLLFGMACGLTAACCYGASNVCQRFMATGRTDLDWAIFLSMFKMLPLIIMGIVILGVARFQGKTIRTSWKVIVTMFIVGLIMQWPGNVMVQIAMSYCGLAMCVPVSFAFILTSGSVFGYLMLGEIITPRSVLSQGLLIGATACLMMGAPQATASMHSGVTTWGMFLGLAAAVISGIAFGYCGVVMRESLKNNGSVAAAMTSMAISGVLSTGLYCWWTIPQSEVATLTVSSWGAIAGIGIFTGIAFLFISLAFQHLSVIQCNIVNATQIALAALCGVLVFGESASIWLQLGTALTIVGLLSMDRAKTAHRQPDGQVVIEEWPAGQDAVLVNTSL